MSDVVFPNLPGLVWPVLKTPQFKTRVQTAASGMEQRTAIMAYPVYSFQLSIEYLSPGDFGKLVGFSTPGWAHGIPFCSTT